MKGKRGDSSTAMSAHDRKRLDISHLTSFRTSTESNLLVQQQQQQKSRKKFIPECNTPSITYYSPYRLLVAPHAAIDAESLSNCDKEVTWNAVEYVVRANALDESHKCPICLGSIDDTTLLFPRISKCGHIFCLFCVTRYLSAGTGAQPCPICNVNISRNELRTVYMLFNHDTDTKVELKREIKLKLLSIYENTLFPYEGYEKKIERSGTFSIADIIPCDETSRALYSRINIIPQEKLKVCIQTEYSELLKYYQQVLNEGDTEGIVPFFDPILSHLSKKLSSADTHMSYALSNAKVIDYLNEKRTKMKYFYQADSGMLIFLHALCFKMLSKQYSIADAADMTGVEDTLSARHNMPYEIVGNIIDIERVKLTIEVKKKLGGIYNHVPTNVEILIVELDMQSLVSKDIIDEHMTELKERRRNRLKKKQVEKKLELDDEYQRAINESLAMYNTSLQNNQILDLMNSPKLGNAELSSDSPASTSVEVKPDDTTKTAVSLNMKSFASIAKDDSKDEDFPTLGDLALLVEQRPKTFKSKKAVFKKLNSADLMFR